MDVSLLAEIAPLAIAAAFSPSGLLFVMLTMSGHQGKKGALLFDIGGMAFLMGLAVVLRLVFGAFTGQGLHDPKVSGVLDIIFGALIVAITLRNIFGKEKQAKTLNLPAFLLGFVYMAINASSLIPFIAANKMLFVADVDLATYALSLVILIVITMSLMLFPVIIGYAFPKKSERFLAPIERFMQLHGKLLANGFFLFIALYLAGKGLIALL